MEGGDIMAGDQEKWQDDYRDCPYEMSGRGLLADLKKIVDRLVERVRQLELDNISNQSKIANMADDIADIKILMKEMVTGINKLITDKPADTFKIVVYDLGLWVLKIGVVGGLILFLLDKFKDVL